MLQSSVFFFLLMFFLKIMSGYVNAGEFSVMFKRAFGGDVEINLEHK